MVWVLLATLGGLAAAPTLLWAQGDGVTPAGPQIQFVAEVPSAGDYRLFLDFQHDGVVRTAQFTVPTGPAVAEAADVGPCLRGARRGYLHPVQASGVGELVEEGRYRGAGRSVRAGA